MFSRSSTLASLLITCLVSILLGNLLFSGDVADLTEREKCPACFGTSMCRDISEINFDSTDFYAIFNNWLGGIKNVYYGNYRNKRVVMKKLASNSEWADFDRLSSSREAQVDFNSLISSVLNNSNDTDPSVKIRLCPTVEKYKTLLAGLRDEGLQELWTTLKINPEPIVLQILNANDGWPTPKYFGACGRLVIEEYIGPPLSAFYAEPWLKRAKIASSLLDAADLFTFKSENFAFYLTDISADNIAVDELDRAIFVDLENIILVDKKPSYFVSDSWNEIHANDIETFCDDCLVFSASDICEHKISDHNYYAICRHILHGFLHDPPTHIQEEYPMLHQLLVQCSEKPHSRIGSGKKLKDLLDVILQ